MATRRLTQAFSIVRNKHFDYLCEKPIYSNSWKFVLWHV